MKHIRIIAPLAISSLLFISLGACSKDKDNTSTSADDYKTKISSVVEKYFDALENCDYVGYRSCQPDFYNNAYDAVAVEYGYDNGEAYFVDCDYGYYVSTIGDNFAIDVTLNSIEEMEESELNTGKTAITETFDLDSINLTKGYTVSITEDVSGNLGNESETYEIIVLEINNELYLYNQYFEYMG